MVRAKLTRTDGSTLELEGTSEEVAAVLAWEACAGPAKVEAALVVSPRPPPPTKAPSHGRPNPYCL